MAKNTNPLIENLLYAGVSPNDYALRKQAYIISAYSWLGFAAFGILGLIHLQFGADTLLGYTELFGMALTLLSVAILRATHNIKFANNFFLTSVFIILAVLLITGDTGGTGIFWFIIFPVGAFFLTNKKQGAIWIGALAILSLAVLILGANSIITLAYSPWTILQVFLMVIVTSTALYAYQQSREELQSETLHTKQSLRKEKIQADMILEHMGDAVVATDRSGHVVLVNQSAEQMLGWKKDELIGKKFAETVHMLDDFGRRIPSAKRPLQDVLQESQSISINTTYVRKDRTSFRATAVGTPIIINGEQIGSIGLIHNVDEEEAVDRAKTEFVTLASHQLRTPVSAIGWLCELLSSGDVGSLTDEQKGYISQINRSNRRMAALVDDMLMVSTLELGNFTLAPETIDLSVLTHQSIEKERELIANSKDVHIVEQYDSMMNNIIVDPTAIKAILQALISNALKYTPTGGKVTVSVRCNQEKVNATCDGSIVIEVSDTGFGIPKNEQKSIFTKLFRASNIKSRDTDGTGLGLFIVQAILKQVGGKISFVSEENKGSTFTVILPLDFKRKTPHG